MAKAMFGAGCFWGIETTFRKIPGVTDVAVGYSGGHADNPSYELVCTGQSGHAEVVEVDFDPDAVTYEALLEIFWQSHDPTQMNRQGPDVGTQYRSAIFTYDAEQLEAARLSKDTMDAANFFGRPIATEITPASQFWRAEEYHQRYIEKRSGGGVTGMAGMVR